MILKLKFRGIDSWHRPVFKRINCGSSLYYGSVDFLFGYDASAEEVISKIEPQNITYFGTHFDCEPMGGPLSDNVVIEFVI